MKKILLYLLILLPGLAFATSGACSGHGGVDCGAGRDYDGSVICSDGWRKSSVSYSSMVKCASSKPIPVTKKVLPVTPVKKVVAPKPVVKKEVKKEVLKPIKKTQPTR